MLIMESMAIGVVLLAVSVIFLKERRTVYAKAVMPLVIVPAMHCIGRPLSFGISHFFQLNRFHVFMIIDIVALIIAALFLGLQAKEFNRKSVRSAYMACGGLFVLVLTLVYLFHLMALFA